MKRLPLYAGTFLIAGSVLVLEVALTRVFAVLMWHHFAYMVVSLALVGFGAAGSILAARGRKPDPDQALGRLAFWSGLCGVTVILAFLAATSIRVHSLEIWREPENLIGLATIFAVLAVPFLMAGMTIGIAITSFQDRIGRVYGADLIGSACGAGIASFLLAAVGASATVMIAAASCLFAGLLYSLGASGKRVTVNGVMALLGILVALGFCGGGAGMPALEWKVPFAPHKGISALYPGMEPERTLHSAVARVDVSPRFTGTISIGGQFGDLGVQQVSQRALTQDGTAPSTMYENASNVAEFPSLAHTQAGSAYVAFGARGGKKPRVLVIGVGGGPDVMVALFHEASEVKAVEINRAMIQMVTEDYDDFIGHLFDHPKVELIHEDGRAYARRDQTSFDIIQMSGVDTYTALSTGAYTLSESYLYTVGAVKDFYARLKPGGYINYSRFLLSSPKRPRETIRLVNIARQALEELGVEDPYRNIAVLNAHGWASTMIRKGAFTSDEIVALRTFSDEENFMGLVADPLRPRGGPYLPGELKNSTYQSAAEKALRLVAEKLGLPSGGPLLPELVRPIESMLRSAVAGNTEQSDRELETILKPLPAELAPPLRAILVSERDTFVGAFQETSKQFIQVQKDFEILLRSDPEERASFVERYFYDLSPATDDAPFFFNYFRFDRLLAVSGGESWDASYHPDFPVGHMVLFSSMAQIVLLGAVLIFLPLRGLKRARGPSRARMRVFLYFAALGMGFMFVEICLMQKFVLFLGHPAFSLSVVLAGILLFSGLGAMASSRVKQVDVFIVRRLLLGIIIAILLEMLLVNTVLDSLLSLPFAGRVLATVLCLAPIGFLLGMPFPLGIRALGDADPAFAPWAWAINGFLSVFSSLFAIVLAMAVGFNLVLLIAAAIYAVGLRMVPFESS